MRPEFTPVLQFLFASYQQNSNDSYDITAVAKSMSTDPIALSVQLSQNDYIKGEVVLASGRVDCAITIKGIMAIDANYVERHIDSVLSKIERAEALGNVPEILGLGASGFQFAFDLANEMQNRDLVKLLYAYFAGNKVMIEMTLEGVRRKARG